MLVLGSVLITAAPGFSVRSDRRQTFCQLLSTSFGNRERRSGFGRVTGASLASLLSRVPIGGVSGLPRTAWELMDRLVFFYDNLGVFVAYKGSVETWPSDSRRRDK
jgi:hypothetical protein